MTFNTSKINWKVLLGWAAIVFLINIDTEKKYPAAAALGAATGTACAHALVVITMAKGKKDYIAD